MIRDPGANTKSTVRADCALLYGCILFTFLFWEVKDLQKFNILEDFNQIAVVLEIIKQKLKNILN